jgi:hypothetical protein
MKDKEIAATFQKLMKMTGITPEQVRVINRTKTAAKQGRSENVVPWFTPNEKKRGKEENELERRSIANIGMKAMTGVLSDANGLQATAELRITPHRRESGGDWTDKERSEVSDTSAAQGGVGTGTRVLSIRQYRLP